MSLYGEYIKERLGDDIIEVEDGFATYRFVDEQTVYIIDIYVKPIARKYGLASKLADTIGEIAKKRGCKYMLGSVALNSKGATESLFVLLAYGMGVYQIPQGAIIMRKEI